MIPSYRRKNEKERNKNKKKRREGRDDSFHKTTTPIDMIMNLRIIAFLMHSRRRSQYRQTAWCVPTFELIRENENVTIR